MTAPFSHKRASALTAALCSLMFTASSLADTTRYEYYANGLLKAVDGPRSDVADITRFEYDTRGNLTKLTNALGHTYQMSDFTAQGYPRTVLQPNGLTSTLSYTDQGWLSSVKTQSKTTTLSYNALGDVTQVTTPEGRIYRYGYDAARQLAWVENPLNEFIYFVRNKMGNVTLTRAVYKGATYYTNSYTFDELGNTLSAVNASNNREQYGYDLAGNMTSRTSPRGYQQRHEYDGLQRVKTLIDALGGVSRFTYDQSDRLTGVTDPAGAQTRYSYDDRGNLVRRESPDSGTTTFTYDEASNPSSSVDARGVTTQYQYDALQRLVQIKYPDKPERNITLSYDTGVQKAGKLSSVTGAWGRTFQDGAPDGLIHTRGERFSAMGNSETHVGYTARYDRDGLVRELSYGAIKVNYARDAAGQITDVSFTMDNVVRPLVSTVKYLPLGPISSMTWGNGITLQRRYHRSQYLISQQIGSQTATYDWDASGNLVSQSSSWVSGKYQYDALERLIQEKTLSITRDYTLDAVGNRLSRITSVNSTGARSDEQVLVYATPGNRLKLEDGTAIESDAAGNQLNKGKHRFTYDEQGRMSQAIDANGIQTDYAYNAFGQRVMSRRSKNGSFEETRLFTYGRNGELLARQHYDVAGKRTRGVHWVWMEKTPVAQVEVYYQTDGKIANHNILYLHTDHLNTPRLASNESQAFNWRWSSDAFGNGMADIGFGGRAVDMDLRFPGQLYDYQTGLHYNYFRDYDPQTGRYVESDPIGLKGGLNTYGYVHANPLKLIDPYGLAVGFDDSPGIGALEKAYDDMRKTKHGEEICRKLEESPNYYLITTNGSNSSAWYDGKNRTIRIDPYFNPITNTTQGDQPASTATIMAHEVGHAATKTWDDGPHQMNNVNANENPIRRELGLPERTSYQYNP